MYRFSRHRDRLVPICLISMIISMVSATASAPIASAMANPSSIGAEDSVPGSFGNNLSFDSVKNGNYTNLSKADFVAAVQLTDGSAAILDRSLQDRGIVASYTDSYVSFAWRPATPNTRYGVTRDGIVVAELTPAESSFTDTDVRPKSRYVYSIVPMSGESEAESWGYEIHTPSDSFSASPVAETAAVYGTLISNITRVAWKSFIPQARVDGDLLMSLNCTYGIGYQYGGDNHGFTWYAASNRTFVQASVNWSTKAVTATKNVAATTVFDKSTGVQIASGLADDSGTYAKKLSSGSNFVDVRLVTHAANPFCNLGAIDGAFSMHLTDTASWSFISGNHRPVPNHMVYIDADPISGNRVSIVYQSTNGGFICLAGPVTCPLMNFTGSGYF